MAAPVDSKTAQPPDDFHSQPRLLCLAGPQRGKAAIIGTAGFTIGRVSANDLCIRDPYVSRQHARIAERDGVLILEDLKSRNGTSVNGAPVRERTLRHGDEISIGSHRYVFLTRHEDAAHPSPEELISILPEAEAGRAITLRACAPQVEGVSDSVAAVAAASLSAERRDRHTLALHRMAQIMVSDIDRPELFTRLADALLDSFRAGRVCVLLRDAPSDTLAVRAASFRAGAGEHQPPLSKTIIDQVIAAKTALLCRDATADPRFAEAASISDQSIRSVLCAPLVRKGELLGVLYMDNRALPDEFDEQDLQLLGMVAGQAAVVVENHNLVARMRQRLQQLQEQVEETEPLIIGNSAAMREVVATARKAADSRATVLIYGESGTGKEVLAKSIHRWSQRSEAPFVVVNCAALADQLLQSDLFGHERGAFTGAVRQKKGRLELAHGGTVFLDEIGELGLDLQTMLLRFLEEREFDRVGGTHPIRVDVRVVAATNRDLAAAVQGGSFRQDLYFRLRVIEIRMPPLRERKDDISLLAKKFLRDYGQEMGRAVSGFSREAQALLQRHDWPGNVRELRNAVERAVVLSSSEQIESQDLGLGSSRGAISLPLSLSYHEQVRELKRQVIRDALERAGGVKRQAAEHLGLQATYLSRLMTNLGMRE